MSATTDVKQLADEAVELVKRWVAQATTVPVDRAAGRLAELLNDPARLAFTVRFIDGIIRPEDPRVAARTLAAISRAAPRFLPGHVRAAVRAGGLAGPVLPSVVIPLVRRTLRRMVSHLLIDATSAELGRAIARLRRPGVRLNLNLLGEAVLGRREADRRLAATRRLIARPDVDYVSLKVSAAVAPHPPWSFDETVAEVVRRLTPLYQLAATGPTPTFINLDMEEYRDLELTIAVFTAILDQPQFAQLEAGIVLQAYLPDTLAMMARLQEWAARRRQRGGAPIKVRVVKGANLSMERVEAELHGWPLATWATKQQTDTNYKRLLHYALTPERITNVRIGVAGHNLFDLAFAWLLAGQRGVRSGMDVEMLLGMAQAQAEVIRREVGSLLLYTPVVSPDEFDVAMAYLVRRLEEAASQDNFLSAGLQLHRDPELFTRERDRFLASVNDLDSIVPGPNRTQDRHRPPEPRRTPDFENAPDTDFSLPQNRQWGRQVLRRASSSELGVELVRRHTVDDPAELDTLLETARRAGRGWGARPVAERAAVLERVADELERRRGDLLEVMAAETGKTLDQSDPEVSEAVDFARYYARRAGELDRVAGAEFVPVELTVVTPPWNFPIAIPAGSVLAALATGSAVVLKPAPEAARCGSVLAELFRDAGVPPEVLIPVQLDEQRLGRQLIADPRVGRVILTGAYETAELFASFRPDLPLLAETSGKNAIVVTPSADVDLAVRDIVRSAFGHAGQKCSAASLVILVGPVATSRRFRDQLVDAVTSLRVGPATDPTTQLGPLTRPAHGQLHTALTTLGPGESWLVKPVQLDEAGQLWRPGVRTGIQPGSPFHLTEYFGPVLGIMTADDLPAAVAMQNQTAFGLTAGIQSLDPDEIRWWLDRVEAGNLYVNRGITGAIVGRQPFGGWKRSAVGPGFKVGGPNYLLGLGDWVPRQHPELDEPLCEAAQRLLDRCGGALTAAERAALRRGFASDTRAWREWYGAPQELAGLASERNLLRYRPTAGQVRLGAQDSVWSLLRVLGAAATAGAPVEVSVADPLPQTIHAELTDAGYLVVQESDHRWAARLRESDGPRRVRLLGMDLEAVDPGLRRHLDVTLYAQPVTESGRLELLPFLREQSISITAHRFGTPSPILSSIDQGLLGGLVR